jgi:hypothetical protein
VVGIVAIRLARETLRDKSMTVKTRLENQRLNPKGKGASNTSLPADGRIKSNFRSTKNTKGIKPPKHFVKSEWEKFSDLKVVTKEGYLASLRDRFKLASTIPAP